MLLYMIIGLAISTVAILIGLFIGFKISMDTGKPEPVTFEKIDIRDRTISDLDTMLMKKQLEINELKKQATKNKTEKYELYVTYENGITGYCCFDWDIGKINIDEIKFDLMAVLKRNEDCIFIEDDNTFFEVSGKNLLTAKLEKVNNPKNQCDF